MLRAAAVSATGGRQRQRSPTQPSGMHPPLLFCKPCQRRTCPSTAFTVGSTSLARSTGCSVVPCSAFCIMLSFALLATLRTPRGCCSIYGPHGAQRSLWNEGLTHMHACRPEAPPPSRCRSYPDAGRGQGLSPWCHAARRSAVSCPVEAIKQGCTDMGCHVQTGAAHAPGSHSPGSVLCRQAPVRDLNNCVDLTVLGLP